MMVMPLPICPRQFCPDILRQLAAKPRQVDVVYLPYGIQMVSIGYLYGMCRSYFDSKAVYFAIRPMCRKRGLRASGGQCGPACAMWCFFIEQAGMERPSLISCRAKRKSRAVSTTRPMYSTLLPTLAPRLPANQLQTAVQGSTVNHPKCRACSGS